MASASFTYSPYNMAFNSDILTPKDIERLKNRLAEAKHAFAEEKRIYGVYKDKQVLRYIPTIYYIQLGDYRGGLKYVRWFEKHFPSDPGLPYFLFERIIIYFKNGKIKD